MGVPFSKEVDMVVNSALDLKPIAATVLQTVRYASALLLVLQIATIFLLALLVAAAVALIFTIHPNLTEEREALVTPMLKWLARPLLSRPAHTKGRDARLERSRAASFKEK